MGPWDAFQNKRSLLPGLLCCSHQLLDEVQDHGFSAGALLLGPSEGALRLLSGQLQNLVGQVPYSTLPCSAMLYSTELYYTTLYYAIVYYTIVYYTILYYTIPYYTILYYTILYYTNTILHRVQLGISRVSSRPGALQAAVGCFEQTRPRQ